ncbi:fibronectin type III domain-containing protein [Schinkia azotoformans]|uniref:fibronectin type III domain-containing protein n=1 Tax=Schinkia azotoformans TaxID=1454 RepID=UPI002E21C3D1|nr:fibronectin type III domain-containing protein [Schinkia azotoformans]MED4353597.1 fibronectin type III domain-containing protein [Schinkia azotoformans]
MKNRRIRALLTATLLTSLLVGSSVYAASSPSTGTVEVITLANTPSNLTMKMNETTDTKLSLAWEENSNPLAVTKYKLEYSDDGNQWTEAQMDQDLNETIVGLTGNTRYHVRISSWNQDSPAKTNGSYLTSQFMTKPAKPAVPNGSVDAQTIKVNWINVPNTTTKLYMNGNEQLINAEDISKTFDGLTPNTPYEITIAYENETGVSDLSENLVVYTDAIKPTHLQLIDRSQTSLTLSIDSNGNPDGTEYQYRIENEEGAELSVSSWMTAREFEFTNLEPGQYKIFAKARNSSENTVRPLEATKEIQLTAGTVPSAPQVTTTKTENSVSVQLSAASGTTNVEFRIVLKDASNQIIDETEWSKLGEGWASNGLQTTFNGLSPNAKYKIEGLARYAD